MPTNAPRGVRLNNPGNIRLNPNIQWKGQSAVQNDEKGFVVYDAPVFGLRAVGRILLGYQRRIGLKTIAEIINRYAPPSENDTAAYIKHVCAEMGTTPYAEISLEDQKRLARMIQAIVEHEVGLNQGQDWFPDSLYLEAAGMALAKG